MHYTYNNVNDAFAGLVSIFHTGYGPLETMSSRAGEVISMREPVTVTYRNPRQRVLFNRARDANPFFHLYEALWMLAGRNDVAPLAWYNSRISDITSDDGLTFNGAYGYRWRKATVYDPPDDDFCVDQLAVLIEHLKRLPNSRRAVLQMWNVEDDLLNIGPDKALKDVCCNLSGVFQVENGVCRSCEGKGTIVPWSDPTCNTPNNLCPECKGRPNEVPRYLNMTVFNRSNDLIWGMLGANVVHFSVLQEYMAAHLGLDVGQYHQISANLHVYTERWKPEEWLAIDGMNGWYNNGGLEPNRFKPFPLVQNPTVFDREVGPFVDMFYDAPAGTRWNEGRWEAHSAIRWQEPFLDKVAQPMFHAFYMHKNRDYSAALHWLKRVEADDWRIAGTEWIGRRATARAEKELLKVIRE